jgi:hypothetical protein
MYISVRTTLNQKLCKIKYVIGGEGGQNMKPENIQLDFQAFTLVFFAVRLNAQILFRRASASKCFIYLFYLTILSIAQAKDYTIE